MRRKRDLGAELARGLPYPARIVEERARHGHHVRPSFRDNSICLPGRGDQPDRLRGHAGFVPHARRERHANAIAPGLTRTPGTLDGQEMPFDLMASLQSIKRGEQVSDIVGAVSFLASDDAAFITGQTLYVNGGATRV